jgi:DNA-binding transcriptional regulator YiaG
MTPPGVWNPEPLWLEYEPSLTAESTISGPILTFPTATSGRASGVLSSRFHTDRSDTTTLFRRFVTFQGGTRFLHDAGPVRVLFLNRFILWGTQMLRADDSPDRLLRETFGERVQRLRRRLGLSQSELASILGVDRSSLTGWELDRHVPTSRNRARLARALAISDEYLLEGDAGEALRLRDAAQEALRRLAGSP